MKTLRKITYKQTLAHELSTWALWLSKMRKRSQRNNIVPDRSGPMSATIWTMTCGICCTLSVRQSLKTMSGKSASSSEMVCLVRDMTSDNSKQRCKYMEVCCNRELPCLPISMQFKFNHRLTLVCAYACDQLTCGQQLGAHEAANLIGV